MTTLPPEPVPTSGPTSGPASLPPVAALREPVERASGRWVMRVTLAGLGSWAGLFGPIQVLLGLQAVQIAPDHKKLVFGLAVGTGSLLAVVVNPVAGALSDRTTSRFGRRVPWVAGGSVAAAACLLLLGVASSAWVMVLAWSLAQVALTAVYAALTAAVPDQVPVDQRGVVGGWVAVSQTLGIVAGVGLASFTGSITAGYLAIAAAVLVLAVPYCVGSRDLRLSPVLRPELSWRALLRGFWISPREHPDFAWAWLTRFLVNLGNSLGTVLLLFYLQDAVHYPHPEDGVFVLTVLYAFFIVASTVVFGLWSDRLAQRKVFVNVSGAVVGVAALVLAVAQTWPGALVGAAVFGVGYGVYLSVDFALCTQVLPAAVDRAKDLGVINVAIALPQAIALALGTLLVAVGGYVTLYAVAGAVCLLASVFVRNIRGVA